MILTIRLSVDRLQNLVKLHTYYVSNAKSELKYTVKDMNVTDDEEFYQLIRNGIYQNINDEIKDDEYLHEDENHDEEEGDLVDIEDYEKLSHIENNNSILQSENYFNFVSRDLVELLKLQEPQVVIEPVNIDRVIDHGNKNFDLNKLLDQQFGNERQNQEDD